MNTKDLIVPLLSSLIRHGITIAAGYAGVEIGLDKAEGWAAMTAALLFTLGWGLWEKKKLRDLPPPPAGTNP